MVLLEGRVIKMYDSLTISKDFKSKTYCVYKDMTMFSGYNCQSITVPVSNMDFEIEYAKRQGFKEVLSTEFMR
jgi:hypothetical protein